MFLDQKGTGALTLQAGRAPGGQRGQCAVLSPVCELCEQGGNGGRTPASRHSIVSRVILNSFPRVAVTASLSVDSRKPPQATGGPKHPDKLFCSHPKKGTFLET